MVPARCPIAVLVESFPTLSETFVAAELEALRALGHPVRVEARERSIQTNPEALGRFDVAYAFEDRRRSRLAALVRLVLRHPLGCLRDLADRRTWRAEEAVLPLRVLAPIADRLRAHGARHLHAHFAAGPALDAVRLSRLLGVRCSVIGHGWDVFKEPRNLAGKLRAADLALAPCAYTARHLASIAGREVPVVVMGVDGERFRRRSPAPGGRHVLAVGRLVEKKGFAHLLEAVALLEAQRPLDACTIVGDGPLRTQLTARAERLGLGHRVRFAGAQPPDGVRDELEGADVLAMPCVVAPDGDRDAMPVAVKEALAMEVPVVASDEVGLPELVADEWGRLVTPGDPHALARALDDVLNLPLQQRVAMGRAGRAHVLGACAIATETGRLSALVNDLPELRAISPRVVRQ